MRKTFYELLASKDFIVYKEYKKLIDLFFVEQCAPIRSYLYPLSDYIECKYLRQMHFRGTALTFNDILSDIDLPKNSNELNDLYLLCELLTAVLIDDTVQDDSYIQEQGKTIIANIRYILEKTAHEYREDRNGNLIIVSKNNVAIHASEMVEDESVAFDLIEYNHFSIKANLAEKKKILSSVGVYIEPILRSRTLQNAGYKTLESDAGFLFNNFHIRHNNKTGLKAQEYIQKISDEELEKWYDRAYEVALAVIVINECLTTQTDLMDLKNKYHWKV